MKIKPGSLVRICLPSLEPLENFGVAVFIRRVIPAIDLPDTHDFWQTDMNTWPSSLGDSWHNEVLYEGRLFLLHEHQFHIEPVEK